MELAGGPLGGDNQFIKAELANQWYVPVVGNLTLAASSNLGVMDALTSDPNDIRYFDFFFMGGSGLTLGTPLRGYKEQARGSADRARLSRGRQDAVQAVL